MHYLGCLTLCLLLPLAIHAADDPLRRIPPQADVVVKIDQPTKFIQALLNYPAFTSAQKLTTVQEVLSRPNIEQFFGLIRYYENDLGLKWPEMMEQIAGHGIAFGFVSENQDDATLVIEGTDAVACKAFFDSLVKIIAQEEEKTKADIQLVRSKIGDAEIIRLEDRLHMAVQATTLILTSRSERLQAALLKHQDETALEARRLAKACYNDAPDAWLWFDLARAKDTPAGRDFYASTQRDAIQNLVAGGTIDALRRADFIAAGLFVRPTSIEVSIRMPAARKDLRPELALHVPPVGQAGSLPCLEPKGVLSSLSFYLDTRVFWHERSKLMNDQQTRDFDEGISQISKFLPNQTLTKLLEQLGPYHRLVMLDRVEPLYSVDPGQPIPGFAYVGKLRDAKAANTARAFLRGLGLAGYTVAGLTMSDTVIDGAKVVRYRFSETKTWADDPSYTRFHFAPCFAVEGVNVIVASREDVVAPVLQALRAEAQQSEQPPSNVVWQAKTYSQGIAQLTESYPDPLVSQLLLTGGLSLEAAQAEAKQIIAWLRTLGTATMSLEHGTKFFEIKLAWNLSQPAEGK